MITNKTNPETIDEYIAGFPEDIREILEKVRATVSKAAPQAQEAMKYGIPTFILNGNLVHFGGFKSHLGFYPTPSGIESFKKELSAYNGAKGSIQFPYDKPIPYSLISKIVKFRVDKNQAKADAKKKK